MNEMSRQSKRYDEIRETNVSFDFKFNIPCSMFSFAFDTVYFHTRLTLLLWAGWEGEGR